TGRLVVERSGRRLVDREIRVVDDEVAADFVHAEPAHRAQQLPELLEDEERIAVALQHEVAVELAVPDLAVEVDLGAPRVGRPEDLERGPGRDELHHGRRVAGLVGQMRERGRRRIETAHDDADVIGRDAVAAQNAVDPRRQRLGVRDDGDDAERGGDESPDHVGHPPSSTAGIVPNPAVLRHNRRERRPKMVSDTFFCFSRASSILFPAPRSRLRSDYARTSQDAFTTGGTMRTARLTRRDAVRSGLPAATAAMLARPLAAMAQDVAALPLITKPIPSTGEPLPVIGVGTNAYDVEGEEAMAPIREVLERLPQVGGKVIDTARVYGRSERVIGQLVEELGNRDQVFVATKTPIRGDVSDPEATLEVSFRDLRTDVIDLMQIHNLHGIDVLMPAFERAKAEGRIRYIGVSTSTDDQYDGILDAMRRYPLDFIQV